MKKKFKIGDEVTFKASEGSKSLQGNYDSYYFEGGHKKGEKAIIIKYDDFIIKKKCYKIHVKGNSKRLYGIWHMLESEFEEYDINPYPKEVEEFLSFN